ncbi:hypothetical protein [Cytobacillus sp. FSL K6-0265]
MINFTLPVTFSIKTIDNEQIRYPLTFLLSDYSSSFLAAKQKIDC